AQALVELNELTSKAQEIASVLGEKLPASESRSLGQWDSQAQLATWVVQFFEKHNGSPPPGVIRILSDDSTRDAVASAIKAAAAADDDAYRQGFALLHKLFDSQPEISTGIVIDKTPCTQLIEWLD